MIDYFLEMMIFAFAVGCFVFELELYESVSNYTIANFVLSFIYYLSPVDWIFWKFIYEEEFEDPISYDEAKTKMNFDTDYDRINPVTHFSALKKHI